MGKILIEQSEWDEVRALATNIIVHGGEARRFGTGKHARWALSFGLRPGASSSGSSYSGPFAVIDSSSTGTVQVTVCGNNAEAGRNFTSQLYLGLSVKEFAEAPIAVGASGYVYLKITYSSDYSIELKTDAELPAQTATEFYLPLAWVDVADGKISGITQFQFGQIVEPGRIF